MQICRVLLVVTASFLISLPAAAVNTKMRSPIASSAELTASNGKSGDAMGSSVAISGNTVVMSGDCNENGLNPYCNINHPGGMAYVFQKPSSGWSNMTQVAELTPSDATEFDEFGYAVAIDGDTIVVGAPVANAAYVFVKPSTGWANMTETAKLSMPNSGEAGISVSISGHVIVMGAPGAAPAGGVYVFIEPAGGWINSSQAAELTASDANTESFFGISVSISGNTIVAGAMGTYPAPGTAYVFVEPPEGWISSTQTAELIPSDGILGQAFGSSISITGGMVAIGAPHDTIGPNGEQGAVYVFVRPAGGWMDMTETAELTASNGSSANFLGSSVATTPSTITAGAYGRSDYQGSAYIFAKPSTGWVSTSTPTAQLRAAGSEFLGFSVGASGKTSVVGAPYTTVNSNPIQGTTFVFGN